ELEDLAFAHLNGAARVSITRRLEYLRADAGDAMEQSARKLEAALNEAGVPASVRTREKRPYSIWRKMQAKDVSFEQLSDIFALRVIVATVPDCYKALGVIHDAWACAPGHFRDYISTPKPNNYRSLHTAVWGPNAQKLEIQIRTKEMHETAERGVAAHWRYKDPDLQSGAASVELGPGAEPGLRDPYDWLQSVVEMLDHGDDPEEFLEHAKLELFQDQVFCFTPKGRLIDLPRGATPLDFAYAVHTRVGDTCVGARVNGQHVPLRTRLRNGDMVEILRSSQGRLPENWASIVATGKARSAIRRLLRRSEQREHAKLGRELAEAAFEREGYQLTEKAIGEALAKLRLPDAAAVFDHVGRGALSVEELLDAVYPGRERIDATGPVAPQRKACIGPEGTIGAVAPDLFMMGLGPGERAAMAPCCCPVPGDRIVGVLGEDGEVAVHTIDCEALARSDPPQDLWRDLRWRMEECARINAIGRLVLTVRNEPGVLGAVTGLFAGYDANIANVRFTDREVDFFEIAVDLEVADDRRLAQIMAGLRAAEEVISVERPRDRPEEARAP
ncbi:MAG: RelA/SpoT AH/RIS domain-containing protein, partial [Pseudomonadota bacterium]